MPDSRLNRRFRILLHLLQRLESPTPLGRPRPFREPAEALEVLRKSDWLGYETMLYEVAATAVQDLERHLDILGQGLPAALPAEEDPWLALDWAQTVRLRALQDALLVAFLESEAVATSPGLLSLRAPAAS